jgi:sugar/nucleoside kinase (ribokinase family)
MSAVQPRFVAVGDLMVDVVVEGMGHSARISVAPGGSAFNAAVTAAGLGVEAIVVGRVGDDPPGRMLLAELDARSVRSEVGVDQDAATGTVVLVDGQVRADRGANARIRPGHLPALEADAVLVSGYLPSETVAAALSRARAEWVALDIARLDAVPDTAPVVLANEETARRLTRAAPEGAARQLAGGRRLACVTLGADGAVAAWEGRTERATAPTAAQGSAFGPGDAFAAGLLASLARGKAVPEALAAGCRAGAEAAAQAALR